MYNTGLRCEEHLLPNNPVDIQGDTVMASDEGFSAHSKTELATKPTASCLAR
jgi:hypothetical protein